MIYIEGRKHLRRIIGWSIKLARWGKVTLTEFAAAIKDLSDHSLSAGCKFTVSNRKTFQLCICWVQRVERTKWEDGRKVGNLQFCHYLGKVDPRQPAHHSLSGV